MPKTAKPAPPRNRRALPALTERDFRTHLLQQAARIAPDDVASLVKREREALKKSEHDWRGRQRPQRQLELALELLKDHVDNRSPQIPYYTVALLASALLYFLDPFDVIPDWVRGAGSSDDALMLELACSLGASGIERYCTWKGIAAGAIVGTPTPSPRARGVARRSRR